MKKVEVKFSNKQFFVNNVGFGSFYDRGFGVKEKNYFVLDSCEILYLFEKNKIEVFKGKLNLNFNEILKISKVDFKDYIVYKDLRSKGYFVKSGLKYGVSFRVYDKGVKVGENHSIWLVEPVYNTEIMKFKDLAGKNRIAHSTKKDVVFGVVDSENSVTYMKTNWTKF